MRYVARILLIALALAMLGLALTPTASPAQASEPCSPERQIPYWWHLRPPQPCGGDSVAIVFGSCRDCVQLLGYEWPAQGPLRLYVRAPEACPATLVCRPDSLVVPLGPLAAGYHQLVVEVRASVVRGDMSLCHVTRSDTLSFRVGCPEPPSGPLPYVGGVRVGPPPPCEVCPPRICPYRSIPFAAWGGFPSGCYRFRGIELLPSPIEGFRPEPPIVRFVVDRNVCGPCTMNAPTWAADTVLTALPPGTYELMMQLRLVSRCAEAVTDTIYTASRWFTVRDSCVGPWPEPCLLADWDHSGRIGGCDDFLTPGDTAVVRMTLKSAVPLAGLQGTISLYPPGLRFAGLKPVGAAQGMHLLWEPSGSSAKFVMFAESGAPIGGVRDCGAGLRCEQPVLAVALEPGPGGNLPSVTHVAAHDLLGSDSLGAAVPECPIVTLVMVSAEVCAGPSCDFNLDGQLDVRDLVAMIRCLRGTGPCADTTRGPFDCRPDGRLDVDDVLCCARAILRGGQRDTMPGRPEPGVAVSFGEPAPDAGGLDLPVRMSGADRVGAARLALELPLDRYEVTGVDLDDGAGSWLEVYEIVDGRLVLGLIGSGLATDPTGASAAEVGLTLHLALRAGRSGGGEVSLADAQFSGRDGVTLEVNTSPAAVTLPGPDALGLRAPRPNPFARETRFALGLDRPADVDVAIHDLSGRKVATLFRGSLPAGPHEFSWQGRRDDGSWAPHGMYFVHARVGGERLTSKVIFLRDE